MISELWRDGIPWELLFADDLALIAESEAGLQGKYRKWQEGMLEKVSKSIAKRPKSLLTAKKRQERVLGTMKVTLS